MPSGIGTWDGISTIARTKASKENGGNLFLQVEDWGEQAQQLENWNITRMCAQLAAQPIPAPQPL